ncbi:hypothetical protein G7046_g7286 [Stylonectria norvegica]|nr:hypothetical protein G7046_g7286 [Stylonectria norvegica]
MERWGLERFNTLFRHCRALSSQSGSSTRLPPTPRRSSINTSSLNYASTKPQTLKLLREAKNRKAPSLRPPISLEAPLNQQTLARSKQVYNLLSSYVMTTTAEIVSAPTVDTPGTCIFIHSQKRSYVFGRVSEGMQRAFNSRKIGMTNTEHIFLSGSVSWDQLGGMFGYILTVGGALDSSKEQLQDHNRERTKKGQQLLRLTHAESIQIHGGENLGHTIAACRPVILRQPVAVSLHEQRQDPRVDEPTNLEPDWQDDGLRVWKMPIRRARSSSPQKRRASPGPEDESTPGLAFKERTGPSDPTVAAVIVEKIMFNGNLKGPGCLIPTKLGLIKPGDLALVKEDNNLRLYDGPLSTDGDVKFNPDDTVWVLADSNDKTGPEAIHLTHKPLPTTTYSQTAMSYIVKCRGARGKFNVAAAKQFGVKPSDYKFLTQGESAKGKDDMTVTPEMVMGAAMPGKGFIVADIESRDFLDPFMERPEWTIPELMSDVVVMYWILGPGLANDPQIQKFVREHSQIKHIFCSKDSCPNMISLAGPGELQTKLRRIDSERFSLLKFDNTVKGLLPTVPQAEIGRAGNKISLMPKLLFDVKEVVPFPNLIEAANSVSRDIMDLAGKAKTETSDPEFLRRLAEEEKDIPNRDAEIIPLGTGSSIPGKYRNVSCTLIRVPGIGSYLLDCGEGTLGQLRRLYGDEETGSILRDLKCIVISHLHADHHLGAPSVIKAWYEQTLDDGNAKLAVSCNGRYRTLLEELSQVEDIGFHRLRFVSCASGRDMDFTTQEDLGEDNFGLTSIKRIAVSHCWRSYATQLELTSGLRIAYSGDCRPSEDFAQACRGAHLLVHECTFDDDMGGHARKKMHSTRSEALSIARKMRARRTLLTHFSQRYVKADSLKATAKTKDNVPGDMVVLMAFDFMKVKLGDFKIAAAYQPAIEKLLAESGT